MFRFFSLRGGGGLAQSKNPYQKKTEVVKKGGGGGLSFFTKSKKNSFLRLPLFPVRDQALVVHNSLFEPCSSYLSLLTRQDAFASSATAVHSTEPVLLTWESWCSAVAWALYVHKIGESYTKMTVSHSKPEMAMRLFFICAYMRLRFMRIDMRISAWNRIEKSA